MYLLNCYSFFEVHVSCNYKLHTLFYIPHFLLSLFCHQSFDWFDVIIQRVFIYVTQSLHVCPASLIISAIPCNCALHHQSQQYWGLLSIPPYRLLLSFSHCLQDPFVTVWDNFLLWKSVTPDLKRLLEFICQLLLWFRFHLHTVQCSTNFSSFKKLF